MEARIRIPIRVARSLAPGGQVQTHHLLRRGNSHRHASPRVCIYAISWLAVAASSAGGTHRIYSVSSNENVVFLALICNWPVRRVSCRGSCICFVHIRSPVFIWQAQLGDTPPYPVHYESVWRWRVSGRTGGVCLSMYTLLMPTHQLDSAIGAHFFRRTKRESPQAELPVMTLLRLASVRRFPKSILSWGYFQQSARHWMRAQYLRCLPEPIAIVGQAAPDGEVVSLDGHAVMLKQLLTTTAGKPVILNFGTF